MAQFVRDCNRFDRSAIVSTSPRPEMRNVSLLDVRPINYTFLIGARFVRH